MSNPAIDRDDVWRDQCVGIALFLQFLHPEHGGGADRQDRGGR
jgi:hypothetical protein